MATLWNNVRGAGRLVALFSVIAWGAVTYAVCGSKRKDAVSKARWLQLTCRRSLRVLAVKVESRGEPAHGAVIVANHMSYLDILVIASLTPVVFVSKKEVRSWPLFGWFAEKAGTRFIDRSRRGDVARIGEEIGPVMAAGLTIVLFLEGTTTDGRDVLPFKASLLEPAVCNDWLVVPAGLVYAVPAGRSVQNEVCWWGDMTLAPHLWNFTTLPWVNARVAWGDPLKSSIADRKIFAGDLRRRVLELRNSLA
ncbi:lysophospholipid acyltransferase family protein [Rariglobus hedericola]|uniref:1-acyl-sn-glycerol-3-phosphate acyltransferase n=1 Tax=Rariglobus hedericola TaxID=2597822 RepID=A0A556QPA8_9BACT|nr:lysophospholipid acyltransferase family protein [Rariglobus hedericola]TSJ78476.1 1-acyl-sn-glycerol-3-phosphate acyltransferase [Rariglobus hedericola]